MKKVLAVILCLLCALFLLVACGDSSTTDTDGGSNNTENGHVHTFKTNEEWTNDAQGHWYEATCDCEDVTVTKLNHTDANNDGACDVCTYVIDGHEHEYSDDWTADCTYHWNAADCGHTVAGINIEKHTKGEDGRCTVCKYVIEEVHQHIYDTEWSYENNYHWHAAICEHKSEFIDKGPCTVNDAGVCTTCNTLIDPVDLTNIFKVLKAAVANNNKVTSGNVFTKEQAYEGSTVEVGKANEVYFVLGNGHSYVKWGSYDKSNKFTGVDQYWYQALQGDEIFGVQMPYYVPSDGTRNNSLKLYPVDGDPDKLSGYTYIPGGILSAYEGNTTLAQTLYNLYDIVVLGVNVSNVETNYDSTTGIYTFSFNYFSVSETEGNTEQDGSGEAIVSYYVEYYEVDVLFTVNSDLVINFAEFEVKSYRGLEDVDEDLSYDPETNTVTLLEGADPTIYTYSVSQTSGERVYTSIYTKEALLPIDFDLSYVTQYEHTSTGTVIKAEEPLVDTDGDGIYELVIDKATYSRLHISGLRPQSANANFMSAADLRVTFTNVDGFGTPWGMESAQMPGFDTFMNCITFFTKDPGTYLVTIKFGQVEKKINLVIPGTPVVEAPEDTDNTKYVIVTETMGWFDKYTFTAKGSGTYTFTLPEGLGFVFEGADVPEYDPFDPFETSDNTFSFDLAKGNSVTFIVGAMNKGLYAIGVSYEAKVVEDDDDDGDDDGGTDDGNDTISVLGTYTGSSITVVIDETTVTFTTASATTVVTYQIVDGAFILYNADGGQWQSGVLAIKLTDGKVTSAVYNGNNYKLTLEQDDSTGDDDTGDEVVEPDGTSDNPFIITEAGEFVATSQDGSLVWYAITVTADGYVTITSDYDSPVLKIGKNINVMNVNEQQDVVYDSISLYASAGETVYIAIGDTNAVAATVDFTVSLETETEAKDLVIGDNYVACKNETFVYTVESGFMIQIEVVGINNGTATVSYSVDGGTSVTIPMNSNAKFVINDGQTLTVTVNATSYVKLIVSDVSDYGGINPDKPGLGEEERE